MIKLFACDLDGTLLNDDHEFDEIIFNAIDAVIKEAYYKTPSTTDYNGVYKGKATIKNFVKLDIDLEAIISEQGDITVNTLAPIVGKLSHSISLGSDYDRDDYNMKFNEDNFYIKFNSNESIDIELPKNISGSLIVTRNVTLNRV